VTCTYDGDRVLDGSAHVLSRGLVSQSASVACSGSSVVDVAFEFCVCDILCDYRVHVKQAVDIQYQM
jgi:hypothetical protein